MPVERDELLTIEEAKARLAVLEAGYRAKSKALRAYIRVLEADGKEHANDE
ncbi:hypothetical protein LCGC14_0336750 [marine sediment metagenome]|uniref:Uncharacterized protein n=1 Tax=marine sediment metagenome TaxID=412755 RepID=A0A0F9TF67_9ZZZZ